MKILATLKMNDPSSLGILFATTADTKPLEVGKTYYLTIEDLNEKRSLNQNSLYWSVVGRISKALKLTVAEIHNRILVDCRIPWLDSEGEAQGICMKDDDSWLQRMDIHLAPTSQVEERKGKFYRWFLLLLPSHLMSKEEMGRLLDRAIEEAERIGIHTEPEIITKAKEY